jgi:hypothetical protein
VEEVDRDDGAGLVGEELSPGWAGAAGCWVDASGVQDLPDGGGGDPVSEASQFAVDSAVAPPGVFAGQLQDELLDRRSRRWSPG